MDFAANSIYLIYPLILILFCLGMKSASKEKFYDNHFSLEQTKNLQGIAALCIMLHHASQKTCASWINPFVVRHGLDGFLEVGYVLVGFFFFCSGYGLYKSVTSKNDYLNVKNFFTRRLLPVIAAFYVTMLIYLAARLWRGQHLKQPQLIAYLTGAMLCNTNAWYCIAIVILYTAFWLAFFPFKNRKSVIPVILVWLTTLLYLVIGCYIDHNDWWFCGEWWYNSVLLFPLGMTWARHETKITGGLKKNYWIQLICSVVLLILLTQVSHFTVGRFGYYGDTWNQPVPEKMTSRFISAVSQNAVAWAFCVVLYIFCMKFKVGNLFTRWMGAVTLEFYLIHGLFIEFFGFNFLNIARPVKYIKNVSLFVLVVFGCSMIATVILHGILHPKRTISKIVH